MSWHSTGFERNLNVGRLAKGGKREPGKISVLTAYFDEQQEHWVIWIYPVRKTELEAIKVALIPQGLVRLQKWLTVKADCIGSNSREPGWFRIESNGHELIFTE